MLIKKQDSKRVENSKSCIVWEYNFQNKNIGFAIATINGRYPESGKALNTKCDMVYFVISGTGTIHHESGDFKIKSGDAFFFEKGKWYWVEGNLKLVLPSAPAWFFEQYKGIK